MLYLLLFLSCPSFPPVCVRLLVQLLRLTYQWSSSIFVGIVVMPLILSLSVSVCGAVFVQLLRLVFVTLVVALTAVVDA